MSRELELGLLAVGLIAAVGAALGAVDPCLGTGRDCSYVGGFKLASGVVATTCFAGAIAVSHQQEKAEVEQEIYLLQQQQYEQRSHQLLLQKQLEADEVVAEERVLAGMGMLPPTSQPVVDVQAQPVQPVAIAPVVPVAQPAPVAAASMQSTAIAPPQPTQVQPVTLPDGAELIEVKALENINLYPVVLVIAGMGNGKTATMRYVLAHLSGVKVLSSHKAEAHDVEYFDLCFGYNPYTNESRWIGDDTSTVTMDERDLTWIQANQNGVGTVSEFVWGVFAEISNRQRQGATRVQSMPVYRCFFDEASFAYTSAYNSPLNPDLTKWGQNLVRGSNALTFMDARTHRVQMFYAAQSESVETIGLKNMSAMRDDAWHLYPGREAIAKAKKAGKNQLAQWLEQRLNQGIAIALLERQGIFWQVLNLPRIADLEFVPKPHSVQPQPQTTEGDVYDLMRQAKAAA